jgi:hypothetical protein
VPIRRRTVKNSAAAARHSFSGGSGANAFSAGAVAEFGG